MKTNKTQYQAQKERARQLAIDWQLNEAEKQMYIGEQAEIGEYFYKLWRRFGLLREFRENAIHC